MAAEDGVKIIKGRLDLENGVMKSGKRITGIRLKDGTVINGMVKNEGDIQTYIGGKAYGISYRAIVPPADECENLLVPWVLSGTHIAFGSIRMEPVFMVLAQSAATAASMAIDEDIPVQKVPYDALRTRLLQDDQRLELDGK